MTKEPDWTKVPASTPSRIVDLLKRCVKKDPRERLRDIGDARLEIAEVVERVSGTEVSSVAPSYRAARDRR